MSPSWELSCRLPSPPQAWPVTGQEINSTPRITGLMRCCPQKVSRLAMRLLWQPLCPDASIFPQWQPGHELLCHGFFLARFCDLMVGMAHLFSHMQTLGAAAPNEGKAACSMPLGSWVHSMPAHKNGCCPWEWPTSCTVVFAARELIT